MTQRKVAQLMDAARHAHQPNPIAEVMLESTRDAAAQIGSWRLNGSAAGSGANQGFTGHLNEILPLHQGNRRRAAAEAMASARCRCFRTTASRALRAERLSEAAGCRRREGESGEAIWGTAENPTPTGQPQRRNKDARRRRAPGPILAAE